MGEIKRVQFIINSLCFGGAERVMSSLAGAFAMKGIQTQIVLISNGTVAYDVNEQVKIVHAYKEVSEKKGVSRGLSRIAATRRAMQRFDSDVVVTFMCEKYVCAAAIGLGKKIVLSERIDPYRIPVSKIARAIRKLCYLSADGYVFQTENARDFYGKKIAGRSAVIMNPLKAGLPEPFEGQRRKAIAAVGRLHSQKNYPMLIKAFSGISEAYPDYKLEIYGEGEERESLQRLTDSLGLTDRVTLCGTKKNVHELINDVSLYVMPSDYEGLPNALMEAMAIGLCCVSTDCPCGGPRALITDGENGALVPTGDVKALAEKLKKLLSDEDEREKYSHNCTEIKEKCNIERITNEWLKYLAVVAE